MGSATLSWFLAVACAAVAAFSLDDSSSSSDLIPGLAEAIDSLEFNAESDASSLDEQNLAVAFMEQDTLSRFTRHAGKGGQFPRCCGGGQLEITEAEKKIAKKCAEENKDENSREKREGGRNGKGMNSCVMDCINRNMNLTDSKGYVKEEEFKNACVKKFASSTTYDFVQKIARECAREANAMEKGASGSGNKKCNSASVRVITCFLQRFLKECSADEQDKSEVCNGIRNRMGGKK